MSFTGTARFQLIDKLGEGGMGVVYEAYDRSRDMRIALKKLRRVDASNLYRFKREFRALRDLSHPNIIALYELVAEGDDWFLTMERVDGCNFLSYVRNGRLFTPPLTDDASSDEETPDTRSGHSLTDALRTFSSELGPVDMGMPSPPPVRPQVDEIVDLERVRTTLRQLAHALHVLHSAGMVHRDLKPSNVFVTAEGRVVLMDFGVVAELCQPVNPDDETSLVGTPAFMAPEQICGASPTAAADWYAFGVLAFVALTGRLPYEGPRPHVLLAKQHCDPLPPSMFADGIPADLEELCVRLLARIPTNRPHSTWVLSKLGLAPAQFPSVQDVTFHGSRIFVGRHEELLELHEAYEATVAGDTRCAFVVARSGMGKSSLVEQFTTELCDPHFCDREPAVLSAQCHDCESLSYNAFDGVIDDLSRILLAIPAAERATLLPADMAALVRVFPVLRRIPGQENTSELDGLNPIGIRTRAIRALRALLAALARKTPVIIYIDDLHWADRDSLVLLRNMLSPPAPKGVLLVATLSSEVLEGGDASGVAAVVEALEQRGVGRYIELGPLSAREQRELMEVLGNRHGLTHLDRELWTEAGGHPLMLAELAWYSMDAPDESARSAGLTLDDIVARRISRLPARSRALLDLVALAGEPVPLRVLAEAGSFSAGELERSRAVLRITRMVRTVRREDDERWLDVSHGQVRHTVLAHLDQDQAHHLHHRLACSFESWDDAPVAATARHWLAAGNSRRAAGYWVTAAERAVHHLAIDRASAFYGAALDLMADLPQDRPTDLMRLRAWIGLAKVMRMAEFDEEAEEALAIARDLASKHQLADELAEIDALSG